MLHFGVTIPANVPQRSEIPEELMDYPVYIVYKLTASINKPQTESKPKHLGIPKVISKAL